MCREALSIRHWHPGYRAGLAGPLITLAVILVAGCSGKATERRTPLATADTLGNGIPRAIVPALSPWIAMWQSAIRGFDVDSLKSGGRRPALGDGYVQPAGNLNPQAPEESATFEVLSAVSPGGRYKLVFDWYQEIDEDAGGINIGGEPDSAPLLIDLRLERSNQFETSGTMGGYHWGCWIDSTRFALAGWAEEGASGDTLYGILGIYSLADSTETRYFTRAVSKDSYDDYYAAWRAWVIGRYRIWKNARPKA